MITKIQKNWHFAFVFVVLTWVCSRLMWVIQDLTIPWDAKNQFYPMLRFLAREIGQGDLPLWNPFHYAGHPTIADPQSFLFNPTVVFLAFLDKAPSMLSYDTLIMAHLLLGAFGLLTFAKYEKLLTPSAILMVLVYMFGGVASSRLQHSMMIISYGILPWAMYFLMHTIRTQRFLSAILFGLCGGLVALGRDQVAFLFGLSMFGFALFELFGYRENLSRKIALLALSTLITLAMLAIPALLTLEFLSLSNRPEIEIETALSASLSPFNVSTLFGANIFGSVTGPYIGPGPDSLGSGEWTDSTVNYLFIGSLPILLLLGYGNAYASRTKTFALGLLLIACLYAFGRHTPVFALFHKYFPGVDLYRRPADASFVINFALSLLSGFAMQAWMEEKVSHQKKLVLGLSAVAALGLSALIFVVFTHGDMGHFLHNLPTPIASFAALFFIMQMKQKNTAILLAMCFTAAELVLFNSGNAMNGRMRHEYAALEQLSPIEQKIVDIIDEPATASLAENYRPRTELFALPGHWQNLAMIYSIPATTGYNALRIENFEKWTGIAQNPIDPNQRKFPGTFIGFKSPLAHMIGIKYVLSGKPMENLPFEARHSEARLIFQQENYWLYELPSILPRVYLAESAVTIDDEAIDKSNDPLPKFHERRQVLIDTDDRLDLVSLSKPKALEGLHNPGKAEIVAYYNNQVDITASTTRPSMLVLHDMMYPGWEVYVDGKKAQIHTVNLLFRGVELPAGEHQISFKFEPLAHLWKKILNKVEDLIS